MWQLVFIQGLEDGMKKKIKQKPLQTNHVGNSLGDRENTVAVGALHLSFDNVDILQNGPELLQKFVVLLGICGQSLGDSHAQLWVHT